MKHFLYIVAFSFAAFFTSAHAGKLDDVRTGDATAAVRNHLGEPDIEFPLNGQLVQDYGYCVIVSSNGVVTAIRERKNKPAESRNGEQANPAVPTIKGLLAKAREGDSESQYCLAYCYQMGEVVSKNMDEAIRWYTLAAMQGHMAAQYNLGVIYMDGKGVPRDYEQAYTWALLAAGNGNDSLKKILLPRLSDAQQQAGYVRAQRILNGLEESPYGIPDSSTIIAQKDDDSEEHTAD